MSDPLTTEEWELLSQALVGIVDDDDREMGWDVKALFALVPRLMAAYTELETLTTQMMSAWEAEKVSQAKSIQLATPADMRTALKSHPMAMKRSRNW